MSSEKSKGTLTNGGRGTTTHLLKIGFIVGVKGVKGGLRIKPLADDTVFSSLKECYVGEVLTEVLSLHKDRESWILRIGGVNSPEEGVGYKGRALSIPREALPEPNEDEVYWIDIEGAAVEDETGGAVGLLTGYLETGAADVFEIEGVDGKRYLISHNKEHILEIDPVLKRVCVSRIGLVEQ